MNALKSTHAGLTQHRKTVTAKELFGSENVSGAEAVSSRDAADRVAQVRTPAEATAMLERAEQTGDQALTQAVAATAFERAQSWLGGSAWARVDRSVRRCPAQAWSSG